MFTGIIEEFGKVRSLNIVGVLARLQIAAGKVASGIQLGQSISVNGVCLTVVEANKDLLSFEVILETIKRTNLRQLKPGDQINLERALKADGRIDGHFVS